MGLSLCLVVFHHLLLKLLLTNIVVANMSFASVQQQPTCRDKERSALLQLKESFVITKSASAFEGHVIGLDLSSSCLFGSINSNSTLFSLFHLQMLSLSDNHFNFSQIPAAIGQLCGLIYLDLSISFLYGQIPLEISNLTKLSFLDMSYNYDPVTEEKFLKLRNPNFETLLRKLTMLEILVLSYVDVSSKVPDALTNFTSLKELHLRDCELYGDFPAKIFRLPNLQSLNLELNENLTSLLPEFQKKSPLTRLE
ncbi:receptor-like protein 7 [Ziziphus jujuba]|uniref:Receptor-like protein 7 n=1 Tax=Ziziphus jujuba TaxID=326968 RepID=A0ABM3IEG4_ZIZJJ|nr:receptor-like protein 7 [Ziziphus jujuba]